MKRERPESPFIVGMFHDLCKVDAYERKVIITEMFNDRGIVDRMEQDGQGFEYNENVLLKGHGEKSVMILSTLMRLTMEEVMCIRYHMGAFTDKEEWNDYTRAVGKYPNVLWTHQADMLAAQVVGI